MPCLSSEDTGFGQWDVHRACQSLRYGLLSVNLVVPLLIACSVWFISVLHAPWKLCDSAAAMLVSIFLMLAAVVMWGSQPWRGVFMSLTYLPNKGIQAVKCEGGGMQPLRSFVQFIRVAFCSAEEVTFQPFQLGFWSIIIKEIRLRFKSECEIYPCITSWFEAWEGQVLWDAQEKWLLQDSMYEKG